MNLSCGQMSRVTACLLLVSSVGCQQRNTFVAPPPPEVTVAQPVSQPIAETLEFTGTTQAKATVELRRA